MSSATITTRKKRAWGAVPDDILCDQRLSFAARVVLSYCVGRPEGWEFRISHLMAILGIKTAQWRAAKKQLAEGGYVLAHRRERGAGGKWKWSMEITDTPDPTIVRFPHDGLTADGGTIDGQAADKAPKIQTTYKKKQHIVLVRDSAAATQKNEPKKRRERPSGIVTWLSGDVAAAEQIETRTNPADLAAAIAAVKACEKEPVPGLVDRELAAMRQKRAAKAEDAAQKAALVARRDTPRDALVAAAGLAAMRVAVNNTNKGAPK